MYDILPREFGGIRYGGFHETVIPKEYSDYFVFTTVRNPYERTVAAWNSLLFQDKYRRDFIRMIGSDKFEDFIRWLVKLSNKGKITCSGSPVLNPQTSRFDFNKVDRIMRIENIDEDFHSLPFVDKKIDIPRNLHRKHDSWQDLKTPELEHLLTEWLKDDLETLSHLYK